MNSNPSRPASSLNLPPLPAYNPPRHAAAIFALDRAIEHAESDMATDPEVHEKDLVDLRESRALLLEHRARVSLGWKRWLPWNYLRGLRLDRVEAVVMPLLLVGGFAALLVLFLWWSDRHTAVLMMGLR